MSLGIQSPSIFLTSLSKVVDVCQWSLQVSEMCIFLQVSSWWVFNSILGPSCHGQCSDFVTAVPLGPASLMHKILKTQTNSWYVSHRTQGSINRNMCTCRNILFVKFLWQLLWLLFNDVYFFQSLLSLNDKFQYSVIQSYGVCLPGLKV